MIGRKLAHYEILEQLGKGGMGEVYRARDTKLGREVALKVLPAELSADDDRRKRFEREAQAIAALKHPNIVTIYSVEESDGQQFITMELVEGETLAARIPEGGLNLEKFFEFSVPLADAISSAHEQGITHRDLKPANIMFDRDGRLKVLDFGLAKLFVTNTSDEAHTVAMGSDTAMGQIMGTAAYMSPEQAEGKPIDHRSDIFSLGILLYEMATGERPFRGDTQISTISAILKDNPQLVSDVRRQLPRHLGRIVSHCIEKSPDSRYQSAKDVRNELVGLKREVDSGDLSATMEHVAATQSRQSQVRRNAVLAALGLVAVVAVIWGMSRGSSESGSSVAQQSDEVAQSRQPAPRPVTAAAKPATPVTPVAPERKMVVVLPFENLGQSSDAYFAAGMTDEITSRISSVGEIGVISRSSATQYNRTGKTMRQIGADLGVDYVLEGTVRWAKQADGSDRVRITPQLIRVSDDSQMWSQVYDRQIDDVFEVQTEIANRMITQLGVTLTQSEQTQLGKTPTRSVEAYKLYLQAQEIYRSDFLRSDSTYTAMMQQVLELDPQFVQAWAVLAAYHMDYYSQFDMTDERLGRARRALRRAEALDPDHVDTHVARGNYYYYGFAQYEQALSEFEAAARLAPSHPLARLQIGNIHRRLGNLEGALQSQKMASLLDPEDPNNLMQLGTTYAGMRRFEEAVACFQPVIDKGGPTAMWAAFECAYALLSWKGDLSLYRDPPATLDSPIYLKVDFAYLQGDYAAALQMMEQMPPIPDVRGFESGMLLWKAHCIYQLEGPEAARPALQEARRSLEEDLDESPDSHDIRRDLSMCLALMGQKAAAVREARLAVEESQKDRFFGPRNQLNLAAVYALIGEQEAAIDILEDLMGTFYVEPATPHTLRIEPEWRSLRDHPRFQALINQQS